jgi:hypothetical protein
MTERESAIEQYLESTVAKLGGVALKVIVLGKRGYPDRLCRWPGSDAFYVETKRPKRGVVAELQKVRADELRAAGYRVYFCKSREEIDDVIRTEKSYG